MGLMAAACFTVAAMHFHSHMVKAELRFNAINEIAAVFWCMAYYPKNTGFMVGTDAPDMQIAYPMIRHTGHQRLDAIALGLAASGVQQHRRSITHQTYGPATDDHRAQDANKRIEPGQAEELARQQGADGEHRGQRIGQNVQIGGTQIVIMVMALMLMLSVGIMLMFVYIMMV